MNWFKSTDDLQPGAYLWRHQAGDPIYVCNISYEHEVWFPHKREAYTIVECRGEFLPVASLLAHHADLERRLAAIERQPTVADELWRHIVDIKGRLARLEAARLQVVEKRQAE